MSVHSCRQSESFNPDSEHFKREKNLIRLLATYILTGLFFMFIPGTLLGVWNLLEIGRNQNPDAATTLWIQAHGHAQLFGWLGTFILGIGFYSIPNLRKVCSSEFVEGWLCLVLWALGAGIRWYANATGFAWQLLYPVSAVLEATAVGLFIWKTLEGTRLSKSGKGIDGWSLLIITGSLMWLLLMLGNLQMLIEMSISRDGPVVPLDLGRRFLYAAVWGWVIPIVWGLAGKWLPAFLGLAQQKAGMLKLAALCNVLAIILYCLHVPIIGESVVLFSTLLVISGLRIFEPTLEPAKIQGVHRSFPVFVRVAFSWLLVSAILFVLAALFPNAAGTAGAARHAITVGFFSTMVFSMGPRVLPAFLGRKKIFSEKLMLWSLLLLNLGCLARVSSEIFAYDFSLAFCWSVLPLSALVELTAMASFAVNMIGTLLQKPLIDDILSGTVKSS